MVSDTKGYYSALGLQPGASIDEIKKAYKKKQVELHPSGPIRRKLKDSSEYRAMTDEQKAAKENELNELVSKVNEAFNVLSDEKKKAEYDSGVGQFGSMGGFEGFSGFGGFEDIFEQMGGFGRRQQPRQSKVKNIEFEIKLEMKDVFLGKTSKFRVNLTKICNGCSGNGGKDVCNCGKCKGTGYVMAKFNLGILAGSQRVECPDCEGRGTMIKGPMCSVCSGKKVVNDSKIIEVNIKPGIEDGDSIVYQKQGNEYPGYSQGDIIFTVRVKETESMYRVGNDCVCTADIDILTALTGGMLYFDHPDGRKLAVSVAPFNDFDNVAIVVPNEGFPSKKGAKGKMFIKPRVLINKGIDRSELSKVLKPLTSKPYGEYSNTNSQLGKVPQQQEEDDRNSGSAGFGFDPRGFASFFG